jgi:hypothetical protein
MIRKKEPANRPLMKAPARNCMNGRAENPTKEVAPLFRKMLQFGFPCSREDIPVLISEVKHNKTLVNSSTTSFLAFRLTH